MLALLTAFPILILVEHVLAKDQKTIEWSGYTWTVKNSGTSKWGPGQNYWSSDKRDVWVDSRGRLHLKVVKRNGKWYSTELINEKTLGYGTYRFLITGRPDKLDPNLVLGLFTYDEDSEDVKEKKYREIDIEFAKWGQVNGLNSSYTVLPYTMPENFLAFSTKLNSNYSTHSFTWTQKSINFKSYGHKSFKNPGNSSLLKNWSYKGKDIPDSKNEKVHINFWQFEGKAPMNKKSAEIIIDRFVFTPY